MTKKSFIFLIIVLLNLFFISDFALAATANHLVISEVTSGVGSANNEFIEIYNPTSSPIVIDNSNFKLKLVNSSNVVSNKTITWVNNIVPAFGYFLFVAGDVGKSPDATFSAQLSSTSGVIISDNNNQVIDMLSWGLLSPPSNSVEGEGIIHSLVTGESLERKSKNSSTLESMIFGGSDYYRGNSEDSDNNLADFIVKDFNEPQSSSSQIEIPEGLSLGENIDPIADCGGNQTFFKNTEISFYGSNSYDLDGNIMGYLWDFGDGSSYDIRENTNHVYSETGSYNLSLKVTDNDGAEDLVFCLINIIDEITYSNKIYLNEVFPAPSSGEEWIEIFNGDTIPVNLNGWTIEDTNGTIIIYTFNNSLIEPDEFLILYKNVSGITLNNTGDGLILKNPDGAIVDQYNYSSTPSDKSWSRIELGSNEWTLDWVASPGLANYAPPNKYPVANAGANINNAKVGENLSFNGSNSSDPDGSIVSYLWNFGDGATASGSQVNHAYSSVGTYQVTLTVKDDDDASSSVNITVTVVAGEILYQNQYSDKIKIVEIMPNPTGVDTEGEYIKISNFDNKDVNLRNWYLDDEDGGSKPFKIDYDLILKPNLSATFYSVDTKILLNNSGDSVQVFDPDKKLIDKVTYFEKAKEDIAYILEKGKWIWNEETEEEDIQEKNEKEIKKENNQIINSEKNTSPEKSEPKPSSSEQAQIILNTSTIEEAEKLISQIEESETIFVESGAVNVKLASSEETKKDKTVFQSDFEDPVKNEKSNPFYQSPFVTVLAMLFCLIVIWRFILLPENLDDFLSKVFSSQKENQEIDNLFK
uniref:PKD domain-containing protein n=1 Tax=candidate division CPR3 bacterium TaxID=2268181 RepID=A0A7C4M0V7_UNCC3